MTKGKPYIVTITYRDGSQVTGDYHKLDKADSAAWAQAKSNVHRVAKTEITDARTGQTLKTFAN
jgi:hypothetical protein